MQHKWFFLSFFWQLSFFIVLSGSVYYLFGEKNGLSVFLGGLAYIVPTLLANIYMHRPSSDMPHSTVSRAYLGNIYKLMITAGLIVFVFKNMDVNAGAFIVCYCLASVVNVVMSFFSINRE
ncbi:ATP synthase subunit I [Vibrio salinus]|uniref:ATP synthase subunit I n=1 Tax=Vibrio salinus TaxID=2899784 RepID=UPI001E5457B3|nr:ATP synthase subunit I [Vibrio salinus]MCE0493617.1 ATP synthase subunit I [Vibrio salinus]